MRIKKLKINDYDVFVYNTKRYCSINMQFLFEMPFTRDNIYMCDLLEEYLIHSTKKYPTRKDISDERMRCYSMGLSTSNYYRGEKMFIEVNVDFYDPELVKEDYLKEAFEFLGEIFFNPNFKDGKLANREELERSRDNLISGVGEDLADPKYKARRSFVDTLYPNTYKTIDKINSKAEFIELMNSYSDKDLIDMYKKIIDESFVGLVIMGNIKDEYLKYIEETFKFKNIRPLDKKFKERLKISKKTPFHTVVQDKDANDSILRVVYECPYRGLKGKIIYTFISKMLSGTGLIIHEVLRDELGIVYSAGSKHMTVQHVMVFQAFINSSNEQKAIDGFDEAINRLKNRELCEQLLKKIREEQELTLYIFDENKSNPFNELLDRAYRMNGATYKEVVKKSKEITVDDILEAIDKMKKVKIHFYEGVKK